MASELSRPTPFASRRYALLLCLLLSACHTVSPAHLPDDLLIDDAPQATAATRAWSLTLPSGFRNWDLISAHDRCVVLTARHAAEPSLLVRCHNPDDGTLRWTRQLPLKRNTHLQLLTTREHLILSTHTFVRALDLTDGALAWTFDPGQGRTIHGAAIVDSLAVFTIPGKLLAVLDNRSGQWIRGVDLPHDNLQAVTASSAGPLALVHGPLDDETSSASSLKAIALLGEGGGEITASSWPAPRRLWSITTPHTNITAPFQLQLQCLDNTISFVGALKHGWLSTLDLLTGETLAETPVLPHRKPPKVKVKSTLFKAKRSSRRSTLTPLTPQQTLQQVQMPSSPPPMGQPGQFRLHLNDVPALLTQEQAQGAVLASLTFRAFEPRDLSTRWSLWLPWKEVVQGQHILSHETRALLINRGFAAIIDLNNGTVRWKAPLRQRHWRRVAFDGHSIFLLYTGRAPRVDAIKPQR